MLRMYNFNFSSSQDNFFISFFLSTSRRRRRRIPNPKLKKHKKKKKVRRKKTVKIKTIKRITKNVFFLARKTCHVPTLFLFHNVVYAIRRRKYELLLLLFSTCSINLTEFISVILFKPYKSYCYFSFFHNGFMFLAVIFTFFFFFFFFPPRLPPSSFSFFSFFYFSTSSFLLCYFFSLPSFNLF